MENTLKISSLTDYILIIKEIYSSQNSKCSCEKGKKKHLLFRGHSKAAYKLLPSILRDNNNEKEIILDFFHYSPQHDIKYDFEKERINILCDMQHNEIPTRLLDWSFAPLNALFFAVKNKNNDQDGEIIAFNPWCYNQKIIDYTVHPRIHDIHIHARALLSTTKNFDYIKQYLAQKFRLQESILSCSRFKIHNIEKPMAVVSNYTNNRILHQRGAFTIHGTDNEAIDKWSEFKDYSWKILIDKNKKEEIYNDLNLLYINNYSIYPDFNGMSQQTKDKKGLFNI